MDSIRKTVTVEAPARVHFGFMDLNASLGRRFGSLGLTVDGISTRALVTRAERFAWSGPGGERACGFARQLFARFELPGAVNVSMQRAITEHVGLGSGTQLALAMGTAVARLYDLSLDTKAIAAELSRGARSGIGIGAFDHGGFLMDGGRGTLDAPPPVTARLAFPREWRVLLLFDRLGQGFHGPKEVEAFARLPAFPSAQAAHICRVVLMRLLPALAERDFETFSRSAGELQRIIGSHFAPVQGSCFTSPAVAQVLEWLVHEGIHGVGQSSWGPTGFAVIDSEARAGALLREIERRFAQPRLQLQVVSGRNRGSVVEVEERRGQRRGQRSHAG